MELKKELAIEDKEFLELYSKLRNLNDIPDLEFALPFFVISAWQPFYRVLRKEL